jgi:hypothetical protein
VLVQPKEQSARLYRYRLGANPHGERLAPDSDTAQLQRQLEAYLQTATASLLGNRSADRERGAVPGGVPLARAVVPAESSRPPILVR